jgi:hypothetical protein
MAIEIKRPLVSDLFAIGSSVGAYGNNSVTPAIASGSYQPPQGVMNPQAQEQGGGGMGTVSNIGGKVAGRMLNNYVTGGAAAGGASTGSGVGYGLGQSLVSGGIGTATYAGAAGAGASAGGAAGAAGYGLGGSLVSGGIGTAGYAGAAGAGTAAAGTGAAAGAGAAGAGAAGGAAAGGAASGAAAAGPFAAIAAAIILNEQDSRSKGLRDEDPNEYYKDLASGKVLEQDVEGKWAPMTDSIFGEKTGLGNDQRFAANLMTGDFKNAAKDFKKSSLMTGFGLWG